MTLVQPSTRPLFWHAFKSLRLRHAAECHVPQHTSAPLFGARANASSASSSASATSKPTITTSEMSLHAASLVSEACHDSFGFGLGFARRRRARCGRVCGGVGSRDGAAASVSDGAE